MKYDKGGEMNFSRLALFNINFELLNNICNTMRIKKKQHIRLLPMVVILLLLFPFHGTSQEWGGEKPINFWDHWSININAGFTSYFGDLSYYDSDLIGKFNNESKPAVGILLTKHFDKKFGVSGQFLYGQIKGGNNKNVYFETNLFEYNIQARLDIIRIILPDKNPKFGLEGFAGIGHTWFNSERYIVGEGSPDISSVKASVPEFVYFGGIGMHYHFQKNFAITTSMSLRHLQNDKLDQLVKNSDNDFYTYLSVGITYYINGFGNKPLKNKARLAHSSKRSR